MHNVRETHKSKNNIRETQVEFCGDKRFFAWIYTVRANKHY